MTLLQFIKTGRTPDFELHDLFSINALMRYYHAIGLFLTPDFLFRMRTRNTAASTAQDQTDSEDLMIQIAEEVEEVSATEEASATVKASPTEDPDQDPQQTINTVSVFSIKSSSEEVHIESVWNFYPSDEDLMENNEWVQLILDDMIEDQE